MRKTATPTSAAVCSAGAIWRLLILIQAAGKSGKPSITLAPAYRHPSRGVCGWLSPAAAATSDPPPTYSTLQPRKERDTSRAPARHAPSTGRRERRRAPGGLPRAVAPCGCLLPLLRCCCARWERPPDVATSQGRPMSGYEKQGAVIKWQQETKHFSALLDDSGGSDCPAGAVLGQTKLLPSSPERKKGKA
jgi:hypothetical protein